MNRRQLITTLAAAFTASSLRAAFTEGMKLSDLAAFGLAGALPKLTGKVVYLDFWASWCAPCKASFPVLNGWHQQLGGKGLVVLGVNVDEREADMTDFLKKNVVSFPIVRDAAQKLVAAAAVKTMPTSLLIDRKGVVRHVHSGFRGKDAATLLTRINTLFAEPA